jgi:hypothetical protein
MGSCPTDLDVEGFFRFGFALNVVDCGRRDITLNALPVFQIIWPNFFWFSPWPVDFEN